MATHSLTGRHTAPAGSAAEAEHFQKHGFAPVPRFIQWMATLRCGMSCPHCLAADDGNSPDMPLSAVERLLDQVAEMGIREFLVTGGEPVARADLPEVVAMLGERGISWTLNTAANPGARLRAAVEKYPPAFVAVSLDGPERVHDRFRGRAGAYQEALEAIRFYLDVVPGRRVTAGTTVTARNFAWLAETFGEVVRSGATAWGLHLLVPEGRAKGNRRLFLSRRKLRALVDFCAARRNYFPVGMADEIGYLGEEEPLVREAPFFCGAGRTQCVVLPGGEVVPCSTLDRAASAGNVLEQSLAEIWAEGFAALRHWQPAGRCKSCEYAPACKGGCWLQRRNGTQCFKAVWRAPRLVGAAAAAVCFGLGAAGASAGEPAEPPKKVEGVFGDEGKLTPEQIKDRQERSAKCCVERLIIGWYIGYGRDYNANTEKELIAILGDDPAAGYFQGFVKGDRKPDVAARCAEVNKALKTKQVSLSLAALMWRDLAEVCLDGKPAAERTDNERKLLRDTLTALDAKAAEWRAGEFKQKLGAFLNREIAGHTLRLKSGPPPMAGKQEELGWKRWDDLDKVTEEFIKVHPFGEAKRLPLAHDGKTELAVLKAGKAEKPDAEFLLYIFDVLRTPPGESVKLDLALSTGKEKFAVQLPAGCELAYPDILRLAYEQNRKQFDDVIQYDYSPWSYQWESMGFPALRVAAKNLAGKEDDLSKNTLKRLNWLMSNFWLF